MPGRFERDPLARPFVHSDATAIGFAVVTNLIARTVFRHNPLALKIFAGAEGSMIVNNLRNESLR
jgi:hypothetical protein